jgi:hypothetical protein
VVKRLRCGGCKVRPAAGLGFGIGAFAVVSENRRPARRLGASLILFGHEGPQDRVHARLITRALVPKPLNHGGIEP